MDEQNYNNEKKKISEKILLMLMIGALYAVKNHKITLYETEGFFFRPGVVNKLKKYECDKDILAVIEDGYVLENYQSVLPHLLDKQIDLKIQECMNLLDRYPEYYEAIWLELFD